MLWWVIGILIFLILAVFLYLLIAGADESRKGTYNTKDKKD